MRCPESTCYIGASRVVGTRRGEPRRIPGDRLAQATVVPYDTGAWNDFDAGPDGFVRFLE